MMTPKALAVVVLAALYGAVALNAATPVTPQPSASTPKEYSIDPSKAAPAKYMYTMTLMSLGHNKWQLYVENTNIDKFINRFSWSPMTSLTVTAVTSSEGGRCKLARGSIMCSGSIAPEPCVTCEGGAMTINFTGSSPSLDSKFVRTDYGGYWVSQGWGLAGQVNVTSTSSFSDLPFCGKGQVSTKAKPCAKK